MTISNNDISTNKQIDIKCSNQNKIEIDYKLKHTNLFEYGVCENQNKFHNKKMEDVTVCQKNFLNRNNWGFFAVFDGHYGKDVSKWCEKNISIMIEKELTNCDFSDHEKVKKCIETVHKNADKEIEKIGIGNSGSTAAIAIISYELNNNLYDESISEIRNNKEQSIGQLGDGTNVLSKKFFKKMLYTSNVGDLRIVLYRNKVSYRLTYDHKATDENESLRIHEKGGLILKNRVNGILAITRSLGDLYIKKLLSVHPFTSVTQIEDKDEFIIMASDGVWDVISDEKACKFVSHLLDQNVEINEIAKRLCQFSIENFSSDNISVIIIKFNNIMI